MTSTANTITRQTSMQLMHRDGVRVVFSKRCYRRRELVFQ